MFIIEGPDSVGKTTVAKRMVELANERGLVARYSHMTRPPSFFDHYGDFQDMISTWAVQDRFHLGSIAYNDDPQLEGFKLKYVEGQLYSYASFILIMVADKFWWLEEKIKKEDREQMFDVEKIVEVNRRYQQMIDLKSVAYDAAFHVDEDQYPTDTHMIGWLDEWSERLRLLGMIC